MRSIRIAFAASLALMPAAASANEIIASVAAMIPTLWFGVPGVSTFVSMLVMLAAVVLVETSVLVFAFRQKLLPALWIVFLANLATTLLGMMLVSVKGIGIIIFLISLSFAYVSVAKVFKWQMSLRWPFMICFVVITFFVAFVDQPTVPRMVAQFYTAMFYSFAMTVFFEAAIFARKAGGRAWRWSLAVNGASYFLLFSVLLGSGFRSGSLIQLEGPRWHLARNSKNTEHRSEAIRKFEELYLWEKSSKSALQDGVQWPIGELQLVTDWAAQGHQADAKDLYAVVAKYRRRHIDGSNAEHYDYWWATAEDAIK